MSDPGTCVYCNLIDGRDTSATLLLDGHIPVCANHEGGVGDGVVEAAIARNAALEYLAGGEYQSSWRIPLDEIEVDEDDPTAA